MRRVEEKMCKAILQEQNFTCDNTRVKWHDKDHASIYLFGNEIAKVQRSVENNPKSEFIIATNSYTLRVWPTKTTCSRLKALGFNAKIKGGEINCNEVAINF